MKVVKRHKDTLGVVLLATLAVTAYAYWGSYMLAHHTGALFPIEVSQS